MLLGCESNKLTIHSDLFRSDTKHLPTYLYKILEIGGESLSTQHLAEHVT